MFRYIAVLSTSDPWLEAITHHRTMDAPPEVLCLIFDHLPKKFALKAVRLVGKTFDQVVVPLLSDQIYMLDKQADMKIANLTVPRFGAYVRTLVLKSVYHISKTRLEISHDTYRRPHCCECFHDRVQHAWKINEGLHAEEQEAAKSGECVAQLCYALSKI